MMGFGRDLPLLDGYLMDLPDPGRFVLQDVDSRRHTWSALLDWYLTRRSNSDANISEACLESLIAHHMGRYSRICRDAEFHKHPRHHDTLYPKH
jgi:hypothetical protein